MKTLNMSNGIAINADLFIIPNSAAKIEDLFDSAKEERTNQMNKICELNGMTFDKDHDWLIECWLCAPELDCDNIADHNIHVLNENGAHCTIGLDHWRNMPSTLLKGKKEGDTISVKIPVWVRVEGEEEQYPNARDIIADFNITLAQTKYRYRRFGTFEETLAKVTYGAL